MKKILISGGSGFIGRGLTKLFMNKGYEVVHLSRKENLKGKVKAFKWDIEKNEIDERAFENVSSIIHLAGAGIADKRWTKKRKQEIIDSRVKSAGLIANVIKKNNIQLKCFTGACAIGYYGAITSETIFMESDPPADDFLGNCCRLWQESYFPFAHRGIRTVVIRTAPVLSANGGMLVRMAKPFKFGIGSPLGNGKQFMPWIHYHDVCQIYLKAIEDKNMSGAYNVAAPEFANNIQFTEALAKSLRKKLWAPAVPAFLLKLFFGEMSKMLLEGSRVSSEKIISYGYRFQFPKLEEALENIFQEYHKQ